MILICYDIGANSLRAKVSRRILEAGLERMNRSVYLGQIRETDLHHLTKWLRQAMTQAASTDSLLMLPVTTHQVWQMEVLGHSDWDVPTITGQQHTLIL